MNYGIRACYVGSQELGIKTNFMRLGMALAVIIAGEMKSDNCQLGAEFECTSNFQPLGNCQWRTLDTLGSKYGKLCNGLLILHLTVKYLPNLEPSGGWCLPSVLVIQSIRHVSRRGGWVNSGPARNQQGKLQASEKVALSFLCLPRPTLVLGPTSAKVFTPYFP